MKKVISYILLSIAAFIFLFPFLWTLISITNESNDIINGRLLPGTYFFENIKKLMFGTNFLHSFLVTTITTFISVAVVLFTSSFTAYGFEFLAPKRYEKVYDLMILTLMVPFAALMVPLFKILGNIGLLDTYLGLMITGFFSVFLMFFFRQSIKGFPFELIEAARIDGMREIKIFFNIFVPSMKSTYIAATVIAFMGSWNSYLWPLLVTQNPNKQTLQLFLSTMNSSYTVDYGVMLMGVTVSSIPVLILFMCLQKQFMSGMVGSGK